MHRVITFLKKTFGNREMIGVEIGTWQGDNAWDLCKNLNLQRLYLIDPYNNYDEYNDPMADNDKLSAAKEMAKERLKEFEDKVTWLYLPSNEAIDYIEDNLDFVYIDGNHSYQYVKNDIETYYPKLKDGGVLSGHDYILGIKHVQAVDAVNEFAEKMDKDITIGVKGMDCPDWWIVK